jgi:hypothetical protein
MSMQRRCDIWKANDQKWYMILGDFEYAEKKVESAGRTHIRQRYGRW